MAPPKNAKDVPELDVESVLVKSVTQSYDQSSRYINASNYGISHTTPFSLHKNASMSVFANRSQTQWTTLPNMFRSKDQDEN